MHKLWVMVLALSHMASNSESPLSLGISVVENVTKLYANSHPNYPHIDNILRKRNIIAVSNSHALVPMSCSCSTTESFGVTLESQIVVSRSLLPVAQNYRNLLLPGDRVLKVAVYCCHCIEHGVTYDPTCICQNSASVLVRENPYSRFITSLVYL